MPPKVFAQSFPGRMKVDHLLQLLCISLLVLLYYPVLIWLTGQLPLADGWIHLTAALVVAVLLIRLLISQRPISWPKFRWRTRSLMLLVFAIALFLLNEYFTQIHIFSSCLLILSVYAYSGFYLSNGAWRRMLIPAGLLLTLLPFGQYLDIYLGFPLRLYTAEAAVAVLRGIQAVQVTPEAVLMVENRAAVVDLDCSGLKGLWVGLIFYLLLSWIEKKSISRFWLMGLGLFLMCLLLFNVLRIVTLVALDLIFEHADWAEAVHVPLGAAGFILSCALAWLVLRNQHSVLAKLDETTGEFKSTDHFRAIKLCGISCLLLGAIAWYPSAAPSPPTMAFDPIILPAELHSQPMALAPGERDFFIAQSAQAEKFRFQSATLSGSILLVRSRYWKAQHDPRNCYTAGGHRIDLEETWILPQGDTVKHLLLDRGSRSAIYWFQSDRRRTSDFTSRVLWAWRNPQANWLMISVLFDRKIDQQDSERILPALEASIGDSLSQQNKGVVINE